MKIIVSCRPIIKLLFIAWIIVINKIITVILQKCGPQLKIRHIMSTCVDPISTEIGGSPPEGACGALWRCSAWPCWKLWPSHLPQRRKDRLYSVEAGKPPESNALPLP